jgi:protein SCO1/2
VNTGDRGRRDRAPGRRNHAAASARAWLSLVALVAAVGSVTTWASERTRIADPPSLVPDFALTDQDGRPFSSADLVGQVALVFFGFTHCTGVCPATLQVLRQATRQLEAGGADPRVVMISVDGERDTPAAMKAFLEPFGSAFIGLTGKSSEVSPVAKGFQAVFFKGMPRPAGGYDVEHTSQVYLIDAHGRLRATFYGAGSEEIASATLSMMQESP